MTYIVTTPPAAAPMNVEQLKTRLRIDSCEFDAELSDILDSAWRRVEHDTSRAFITQGVTLYLDCWPAWLIILQQPPVQSVESIQYYDGSNGPQVLDPATYQVDLLGAPGRISLTDGSSWPTLETWRTHPIEIHMTCGYGDTPEDMPADVRIAITAAADLDWSGADCQREATYHRALNPLKWTYQLVAQH